MIFLKSLSTLHMMKTEPELDSKLVTITPFCFPFFQKNHGPHPASQPFSTGTYQKMFAVWEVNPDL